MSEGRAPFGRREPTSKAKRHSILVFTEGKKTEPLYLLHWYRIHRDRVVLTIDDLHGVTPLQLVKAAVARRRQDLREAKRLRGDPYDEYRCVFDIDEHPRPNIDQAIALASANQVSIAISNPCIELWFLIHFKDQRTHLTRWDAQRQSRQELRCDKVLTSVALNSLMERHEEATRRAQALDRKHAGDGSLPGSNPSTEVWKLINQIRPTQ